MKKLNIYTLLMVFMTFTISCEIDETVDPNNPSAGGVLTNASIAQLNELSTGILARASTSMGVYHDITGVLGREIYRIDVSDPRWVSDMLGTTPLDNSAFYTGTNFSARYNGVKTCNLLIEGVQNTEAVTPAEMEGYLAFAKTFQAHALLFALNHQYNNGIRIDVADPDALGPFTSNAAEGYTAIAALLAEAAVHNGNAGTSFAINFTAGFDGFDTPATFGTFIKAIQARVALYEKDYSAAVTFADQSFLDESGNFDVGVYRVFANAPGDRVNALFFPPNTNGTTRLAHNDWVGDAEVGDLRLSKATLRTDPATILTGQLFATHDAQRYTDQNQPMAFVRNEELILIKAEGLIQQNTGASLAAARVLLDKIRIDVGGLSAYAGAGLQADLLDEMLNQRRYSLFDEGHRWIDMRRYDRLNQLTLDLPGHATIEQLPRPFNEIGVQGG